MPRIFCFSLAVLLGVGALGNGVYMLVAPESWAIGQSRSVALAPFARNA